MEPRRRATHGRGLGRSHGKAILFGEHAVVHGAPAIVVPVPALTLTAHVTVVDGPSRIESSLYAGPTADAPDRLGPTVAALQAALDFFDLADVSVELRISSDLPASRGLGSSAATGAAVVAAIADLAGTDLTPAERHDLIQTSERVAHGAPSGIDAHGVVSASPLWFHGGAVEALPTGADLTFVLADTGVAGSTRTAVDAVRRVRDTERERFDVVLARLTSIARTARTSLAMGDRATVGALMDESHGHLAGLGVSGPELDTLAAAARAAGALGAKLTGGGLGGCLLALAPDLPTAEHIAAELRAAGATAVHTSTTEAFA
ncbi:mevalonate kinase [Flavimobilis soli]|uniref:mevalonate kinase n=1 Tax=Flavimobilis soli TaxID=442709 RepID=UPI001CA5E9ED|nr:mevalonate kinase [Flavimobilis soli]